MRQRVRLSLSREAYAEVLLHRVWLVSNLPPAHLPREPMRSMTSSRPVTAVELTLCGSGAPVPCSARQPRLRGSTSSGKEALMNVSVGMGRASQALPDRGRGRHRRPPAQPHRPQ
jgi:hypothetical protein